MYTKLYTTVYSCIQFLYITVYKNLYSASSRTCLRCATASRKSALISAIRTTKHQHHTARPRIRAGLSRDVPVYFPSFRRVLIPACHRGRAQAEYRPGCLVRSLSQSLRRSVATTIEPCSLLQKTCLKKSKLVNNFGRCGPIFTIFSPVDSQEKSLRMHHKDLHYPVGICVKTTNKVHTV